MNRRKKLFANKLHATLFSITALAALVPAAIAAMLLYYLIFDITAREIGMPEVIAQYVLPAAQRINLILLISVPPVIIFILLVAHGITGRIAGPFDRIVKELDEHLNGTAKGHIKVRKSDKFSSLVDKLNSLFDKLEAQS